MRARRLRRLGQVSGSGGGGGGGGVGDGGGSTAIGTPPIIVLSNATVSENTPESSSQRLSNDPPEITLDAQKNKMSTSTIEHTYDGRNITTPDDDDDDTEQKQKHQKFEEDLDVRQKKETFLNNNEDALTDCKPSNLTASSRLLREFEQYRENTLNQNIELANKKMDITESIEKGVDADSGIENMETDDVPSVVTTTTNLPIVSTIAETENRMQEPEICLSRILNAFWAEHCEGQIIVEDAALAYKENTMDINVDSNADYDNLVSSVLVEIFIQYFDGKRIDLRNSDQCSMTTNISSTKIAESNVASTSAAGSADTTSSTCAAPLLKPFNPSDQAIIKYLIGCHDRCNVEYSNYNDARKKKEFGNNILDLINATKQQIIKYSVLILNRTIKLPAQKQISSFTSSRSALLELLYENEIPSDYLQNIISEAYRESKNLTKIFGTLVDNLYTDMQSKVVGPRINTMPIAALNELFNVTLLQEPNIRPICNLVGKMYNFYPILVTDYPGREITKASYLGPFLSVSVFHEENPRLLEEDLLKHASTISQNASGLQSVLHIYFQF